jgi:integrase/recombinase XerD
MKQIKKYPSQDPMFRLAQEMKLRNYSKRTIRTYTQYITKCLAFANKGPRNINRHDIRSYLTHLADTGLSASTLNTAYSALQFYFAQILRRSFFTRIPRAKKPKTLPTVLSTSEVQSMIQKTKNSKHRCMLSLLYGSGLRVQELTNLRVKDIDLARGAIQVKNSKGAKDRQTLLPKSLTHILDLQKSIKRPSDFLFTGREGRKITTATIRRVVAQAAKRANIDKRVTPHTLRHSFATHLLESGTNIRYIQTLLGHAKLQTTELYTHVASNSLAAITCPLDIL